MCGATLCMFVIIISRTCTINKRSNNARPRRTRVIAAHYARGEKTAAAAAAPGARVNYMRNYHFTIVNCRGKASA